MSNYVGKGPNPYSNVMGQPNGVATLDAGGKVPYPQVALTALTASLGADVLLNNSANYFDGPSLALGTGTWFVSCTLTYISTAVAECFAKLWDGTTIMASADAYVHVAGGKDTVSLSGIITNPVGNVRVSMRDSSDVNGKLLFNASGNGKDCTISAVRIA